MAVQCYARDGWPQNVSNEVLPYFRRKDQIVTVYSGEPVSSFQIVAHSWYWDLHESHPGIVCMKGLTGWPGIEGSIEKHVKNCDACQVIETFLLTKVLAMAKNVMGKNTH